MDIQKTNTNVKESVLAVILRWLLYSVTLIPLVIWQDYVSPFHFGKALTMRVAIEMLFILYTILVLRDRSYAPKATPIFITTILFFVAYAVSTLFSFDAFTSMWGTLERMGGLYSLLHLALFFVMLSGVMKTTDHWLTLVKFSVVVSLVSAFYGFLQKTNLEWVLGSGGRTKIFGTIGNPALFAGYMLTSLFLSAGLFFTEWRKSGLKYLWLAISLVGSLAVLMSGVRGSVIALFVGWFLILMGIGYLTKMKRIVQGGIGIAVIVAVAFISIQLFKDTDFVKKSQYLARYADFSFSSYTIQTRTWTWTSGLQGWIETPRAMFIGFGPENFQIPFVMHFNPNHFRGPGSETLFDRAHNMFIEVLVTMGIVGFIIYIAMFSTIIHQMFGFIKEKMAQRKSTKLNFDDPHVVWPLIVVAIILAYCIHNFFIFDTTANYIAILVAIGFASFMSIKKTDEPASRKPLISDFVLIPIVAGMIAVSIYSIYTFNVLPARANYMTTRAMITNWTGNVVEAFKGFEAAIDMNTPYSPDLLPKMTQVLMERYSGGEIPKEVLPHLEYAFKKHVELSKNRPFDNLNPLYAARMAVILGRIQGAEKYNDIALQLVQHALQIAPKFVRSYYELGQVYLNKGDKENALGAFKQAAELSPTAGIGYWYVGNVLMDLGRRDEGLASIKKSAELGYAPKNEEYLRLANLFIKNKDDANALRIYEAVLEREPNNTQMRATIAAGYVQLKKLDKALEQLRAIIKIDPKLQPDVEAYAKSVGLKL